MARVLAIRCARIRWVWVGRHWCVLNRLDEGKRGDGRALMATMWQAQTTFAQVLLGRLFGTAAIRQIIVLLNTLLA